MLRFWSCSNFHYDQIMTVLTSTSPNSNACKNYKTKEQMKISVAYLFVGNALSTDKTIHYSRVKFPSSGNLKDS